MKTLYICRHAKSSWKDLSLADIERPLNKRGKRDAPFMGKLLSEKKETPDVLVTSPAVRARKTAKIYADALDYPREEIIISDLIYESGHNQLVEMLKNIEDKYSSVMIFGHNPGFTLLSNYLADSYIENIPTCGVVKINFEIGSWKMITHKSGKIEYFEYPKLHLRK